MNIQSESLKYDYSVTNLYVVGYVSFVAINLTLFARLITPF